MSLSTKFITAHTAKNVTFNHLDLQFIVSKYYHWQMTLDTGSFIAISAARLMTSCWTLYLLTFLAGIPLTPLNPLSPFRKRRNNLVLFLI